MIGSRIQVGESVWEVKEFGSASQFTGPYPDIHGDMNVCLRDLCMRMLHNQYHCTRKDLAEKGTSLGPYEIVAGPVVRLYMDYDEDGNGIGVPLSDRAAYTYGWRAKGLVPV